MRYIAAYLLASLGENQNPSADSISKIFSSVGIEFQKEKAEAVLSELSGKSIQEVIASGSSKLASVPTGSSAPACSASSAPAAASASSKKEEKKVEKEEDSDADCGFGLFD